MTSEVTMLETLQLLRGLYKSTVSTKVRRALRLTIYLETLEACEWICGETPRRLDALMPAADG